ncbi:hypothetical protein BCR44DRAFT_33204, partial [Catenaria anguillulae PL171]
MSIVVIYTFAAVIGLARKATGVLIPAMGLDTHWISPATVPAPAPAVLDHHDSLTQLSAAEAGQSNEPTHMTTASSNLAASRHDTDEQSAMQAADAVLVKDHHVIPAQQKRQESKADQELKMCKQELEHARQQLAAVQSEAAKTAARQGTAKISAMQAEATTSAAKLKAAEYEAHKLGMYLDMATKMDAMDLKQAHAKFTAERRLLVTALSDIALGGLRARRQLAVARIWPMRSAVTHV